MCEVLRRGFPFSPGTSFALDFVLVLGLDLEMPFDLDLEAEGRGGLNGFGGIVAVVCAFRLIS